MKQGPVARELAGWFRDLQLSGQSLGAIVAAKRRSQFRSLEQWVWQALCTVQTTKYGSAGTGTFGYGVSESASE
jgi:hypothetical protein